MTWGEKRAWIGLGATFVIWSVYGVLIARGHTDYDELNRVRARRGNNGQETGYTYDLNGNLQTLTRTLGQVTQFQYDALNRLSQQTDAELGVTSFEYDKSHRITQVTDPRGLVTQTIGWVDDEHARSDHAMAGARGRKADL